jgi:hypothetical protein
MFGTADTIPEDDIKNRKKLLLELYHECASRTMTGGITTDPELFAILSGIRDTINLANDNVLPGEEAHIDAIYPQLCAHHA